MESGRSRFITKPVWLRFFAALLFVLAALGCTSLLWLIVERPISSVLFLVAISMSAWLCGFRAGVFASIISGFLIDYFFIPPTFEFIGSREELVRFSLFLTEGVIISWLLDAKRIATDQITHSREQLQALTTHLQSVRESEQKRIALEIHDELGQALTGLKMEVHWLKRQIEGNSQRLPIGEMSKKLGELLNEIDASVSTVRRIATELRPSILDDFGLVAAIEWQTQEFERKTGIRCYFQSDVDKLALSSEAGTAVFRIFQETLTNITRHARASSVRVELKLVNGQAVMKVADDGVGISADASRNKHSLGILGMNERAKLIGGTFEIHPEESGGTVVELWIPIADKTNVLQAA